MVFTPTNLYLYETVVSAFLKFIMCFENHKTTKQYHGYSHISNNIISETKHNINDTIY